MGSRARRAPAIAVAAAATAALAAPAASAGELYLQQAGGGTLTAIALTLTDVGSRVTSFADRPQRSAGSEPTTAFVRNWARRFGDDPPNAALELDGAPRTRDVAIVELRRPRYDARAKTLTFPIRRIGARALASSTGLRAFASRADAHRRITRFGRATLFVDSGATTLPGLLDVTIPAGSSATITLGNATFDYNAENVVLANMMTPPSFNSGSAQISIGEAELVENSIMLQASPQGGGIQTAFIAAIDLPSDGSAVTGTASIPAGANVTFNWPGQTGTPLANGAFTLPQPPS